MRPSRGERTTTSCGECRRRKQKCNQGQPCSNCSRRFPPPSCEYHGGPRHPHSPPNISGQPITVSSSSNPIDRIFDPTGIFSKISSSPPTLLSPSSQWPESPSPIRDDVVRWSGIDLVTQSPAFANTPSPYLSHDPVPLSQPSSTMNAFPRSSLDHVGPIVPTWGQSASTLLQNNPGMSDYFLLPAWVPNGFTDEALGWFTMGESGHGLAYGVGSFDGGSTHGQGVVPSTAAWSPSLQQDDGLLRIFVRTLAPFHAALDGVAVPSHPYLKHYVPFIMQSPLLRQTSIYTSAGFLRDQGHMDETTMLSYKVKAIGLFNSHFSTQTGPNDEIIAAHIQLTLIEWYWSNNGKLDPHLRILGELIRPRGGLQSLGLQCLIAKMAVTLDTCISLTTSASPILRSISLTKPPSSRGTTGLCFNTPFVSSFPSFGACVETMNLAPATAKVLDELRFLISAVLALSTQATEMELAKIRVTGSYVYQCILRLGHTSSNQTQGKLPASSHSYPTHHPSNQINDPTTASILPNTMSTDVGGLHPGTTGMVGRRPGVQRSTSSPIVTLSHTTKSGRASSEQQFQQGTAMPPPNPTSFPAQQPVADPLFPAIRLAGLVYARAISNRQSFQSILTEGDLTSLWQAFWRVPLSRWKEVLGVCNWILVPFLPIARNTKQGRVIKNLVFNGLFTMGVEDWEVATSVMERMEGLRVWLAGGGPG